MLLQTALDSLGNSGPHGLSEIIYLFASSNANNGSAFAGINGNTLWFNTTGGLAMLVAIFPGPVARAGRRALPDARRQDGLTGGAIRYGAQSTTATPV